VKTPHIKNDQRSRFASHSAIMLGLSNKNPPHTWYFPDDETTEEEQYVTAGEDESEWKNTFIPNSKIKTLILQHTVN